MSSSYYASKMAQCNVDITDCKERIRKLEIDVEELGKLLTHTNDQRDLYDSEKLFHTNRNNTIATANPQAKFSRTFTPLFAADLSGERHTKVTTAFEDAVDAVETELANREKMLEDERTLLESLESDLVSYTNSYYYWLHKEAQEREKYRD